MIARRLNVSHLKAEWIGGNILLDGVPNLTRLPPRTILMFDNGATIRIDGDNLPCSHSGRSIASNFPGREDLEQAFVKHASGLRGLVGWVEKPGILSVDEGFEARLPEQWIYTA